MVSSFSFSNDEDYNIFQWLFTIITIKEKDETKYSMTQTSGVVKPLGKKL